MSRTSLRMLGPVAVAVLVLSASAAHAAPGDLDTTFHTDGIRTTEFFGEDLGNAVAMQSDGKIVVAGSGGSAGNFVISRYLSNGALDAAFSGDGKSQNDLGSPDEGALDAAIQADGKIVVAGYTFRRARGYEFALMRYNTNGTLDRSFDGDGKLITDFTGGHDVAHGVAIQPNGKIVVGGEAFSARTGTQFALARYNSNGALDSTFSGDGKRMGNHPGGAEAAFELALQSDGKIVLVGTSTQDGVETDFVVGRFTSSGNNDSLFSGNGWDEPFVHEGQAETEILSTVAIRPDGKLVVGGFANVSQSSLRVGFTVLQLLPGGGLDPLFGGTDGWTQGFVSFDAYGNELVLQSDGKALLVGGVAINSEEADMGVLRLNEDGSPDTGFGTNGEVITAAFDGSLDTWYSAALQSDGKLVTSGATNADGGDGDIAIARYLTA